MQTTLGTAWGLGVVAVSPVGWVLSVIAGYDLDSEKPLWVIPAGLALACGTATIQNKIAQPINDRIMSTIVEQANKNIATIGKIGTDTVRTPTIETQFDDTVYRGKAKVRIATSKPEANAPTHLCLRIKEITGYKIDVVTRLRIDNFGFNGNTYNERCYSTGPDGKFHLNPRISFGTNGPAL